MLCYLPKVHLFIAGEMSEMSAISFSHYQTTQPRPQVFSVNSSIICNFAALLMSSVNMANFFQIWSTIAGYDELCVGF